MQDDMSQQTAGGMRSRLFVYNGGFLLQPRLRRILDLAGYDLRLGLPKETDLVGIWGNSPTAHRGRSIAERYGTALLNVEDAFLRSIHPGRAGEPPLGLLLDRRGAHFDPAQVSDLEQILASHPLDDSHMMRRARAAIGRLQDAHLSKYNAFSPEAPLPEPGYVLVVDQLRGDASVTASKANRDRFREMLYYAQEENPGARIVIKTHPETTGGHRPGHYGPDDTSDRISLCSDAISPWVLMEGATAVYTVSSQLGFEAILAGHKPQVFGQPFYAGWGLTEDRNPVDRRRRRLTRAQLVAGALILYPRWYDPYRDRLCGLEDVLGTLEAEAQAWRQDRHGHVAVGMRAWKRGPLQRVFGRSGPALRFAETPGQATRHGRPVMVWAGKETEALRQACDRAALPLARVEDGFLRSRGLGADLVPPLSLVLDDLGIYYDPTRASRLEHLITCAAALPPERLHRADRLVGALVSTGVGKYNLGGTSALPDTGGREVVLVPGQVEDDASIRAGAGAIKTNLALLQTARDRHPGAFLVYKPHPDVEAGLRTGRIAPEDMEELADHIAVQADPMALIAQTDRVVTMTSLLGFEALLRGVAVTVTGTPFYAGWGLTEDLGPIPARRRARPSLSALAHATLIAYPRYHDPVTGRPCPVEVAVDRLASGNIPAPALRLRALAKLQGWFAGHAWIWRR